MSLFPKKKSGVSLKRFLVMKL